MPVELEKFVKQLADSGIIAPGKLENFIPPKAHPKDADELARELIKHNQLTKFQAHHVLQGKSKALFLGNYTVLDKIGAGGMGQVFKAEHRRMKRIVALKMLPPSVTKDASAAARFQREVEVAARLRHPNIVAADDADEANGAHFLVMEYVEGKDLSALVKQNGPFSVDKAVNYILQAARGLEFAHGEGVVHRDIKPANLLLDKKGTVKILDMGLARIDTPEGDVAAQAELTGSGAVMGTIDYMAPEQALSTHHADARADIYSLGCSLHYLLTGKAIYGGNTLMAKMLAHRENPIPSLRGGHTAVPEPVEAVFRKMVAKRVEDRYQTMGQVVAALERCGIGHDVSINMQHSLGTAGESIDLTLLKNTPVRPILVNPPKPASPAPTVEPSSSKKKKKRKKNKKKDSKSLLLIGGGLLAVALLLAAVIFKMQTKEGTLIVAINQPDAVVQVLSAEGKVEISQPGGKGALSISVDPGKHRLRVEKNGYKFFVRDFEMQSGGRATITATLEPINPTAAKGGKLVLAGDKPSAVDFALDFDGIKSHVATPIQYDGSYPLTVEARVAQHGRNDKIQFIIGDSENGGINLSMQRGLFEMGYRATSTTAQWGPLVSATSKGVEAAQRVYHVAGVFNRNVVRLFVDGVLQSTAAGQPLKVSPMHMLIGANPGGPIPDPPFVTSAREVFDGSIDEVRISKVARYQGNFTPVRRFDPDADTIALYHFDEGSGVTAHDASGHGNSAIIVGAKWVRADSLGGATSGQGAYPSTAAANKPITTYNDPAFQQWMKDVAALPAQKQVDAVAKKLQELNLGFDGKVRGFDDANLVPKIEQGVVTAIGFVADRVTNISPVRALTALTHLDCRGSTAGKGKLSDLSPLEGMKLTGLICSFTQVSDLSPLKGMPLTDLRCSATPVSNLSPLREMPLQVFYCYLSQVSDLSPLQGMDLTDIRFTPKNITQGLNVLRQMKSLRFAGTSGGAPNKLPRDEFWKKYDAGEFGKAITTYNDPAFQQWVKTVAALPAEQQVEAVVSKLVELNPAFDGKVTGGYKGQHKIENGVVTEIGFATDDVSDISPVRAFAGLKTLNCSGTYKRQRWGVLSDLSPLQGMHLTTLRCMTNHVSDLSPLRGMPLTKLYFSYTDVADLSPLEGMPLTTLECAHTKVSNLAPLEGIRLTELICYDMQVSDLSPLRGMPLKQLNCGTTKVSDLSPLKGMPLNNLVFDGTSVSDLSPLQGMNLTSMALTPKNITRGLDVVRQMKSLQTIGLRGDKDALPAAEFWQKYDAGEIGRPIATVNDPAFQAWMKTVATLPAEKQVDAVAKKLQELNPGFNGKVTGFDWNHAPKIENGVVTEFGFATDHVTDIAPVRALVELRVLRCTGTGGKGVLSDLSPLQGMKLTQLDCIHNPISSLSPLQGMPLTYLRCGNTKISDLSPLIGMQLTELQIWTTTVSNLAPLKGMNLTTLHCGQTQVSSLVPLQGMKLKSLRADSTKISDLSPLKGMPLAELQCDSTQVTDLSPLAGISLQRIAVTPKNITKGMDAIRQMKSVKTISIGYLKEEFPATEFWKKYDAGVFGKPI